MDPPLKGQRAERDLEVTRARKARKKRMMKEEAKRKAAMRAKKEAMDYNRVFEVSDMTSSADLVATSDASAAVSYEEDFM